MNRDDQSTQVPQLYLWAVGLDVEAFPPGKMLGDRYLIHDSQVVIDTQQYRLPESPDEIPSYVVSYLKLSRLPLHLPRPYGLLRWGQELSLSEVLLLENIPVSVDGHLLPTLASSWAKASALRQINWLWQVLQLWQPLAEQNMTRTLLKSDLLRVDGSWVRLLELQADVTEAEPSQLGDLWKEWLPQAQPEIAESLADCVYALARKAVDVNEAIAQLDELANAQFQTKPFSVRVASGTDQGPSRDHNEDTCYPDPKQQDRMQHNEFLRDRVAIICDGLGGHEGGEVASTMAIKTIEQQLQILLHQVESDSEPFSPAAFSRQLESIIRVVNNQIVALNDQQQRQAQQRMGTTLVMAVIPRSQGQVCNQVYIVHVGDSRIYWVSPQNCRQVTLDDDVATRESVLGYNFYIYSHQRVDGGALIQALGTRASDNLVPRIQRFQIDEDCLLLLCSDGLSDFERVNELYDSHIRPILTDNLLLGSACRSLINEANTRNGHDNVTVALMRCRLTPLDPNDDIQLDNVEDSVPTEIPSVPTVIPADYAVNSEPSSNVENFAGDVKSDVEDINPKAYQATDILPQKQTGESEDINLDETEEDEDDSEDSSAPEQTSLISIILIVVIAFLMGCGIFAAIQTPFVKQLMQPQSTPQVPQK
ncbi:PP2C family protein-serine/threonine phosphatase [Pseudanabaena sp. PCC 6802]|uniref:PP2C family protein-serine/threonine phosphatase n=1 Tax=Pseudanabaena sp. PCC 6802 TaxID=118173 RepID=UPI0003449512|nr:protein phosphatase 2C domain-containing protein [Pseudanabaena sp. PCC 6802]